MKTPPAASIRLGASLAYRGFVLLLAIILVAAYALFIWTSGVFSVLIGLPMVLALAAIAAGLWDAWRPRTGALHYAAGQWVLAQEGVETQGTLQVAMNLHNYLMVRFTPSVPTLNVSAFLPPRSAWLHLEYRHSQDWRALRRALFAVPHPAETASLEPREPAPRPL